MRADLEAMTEFHRTGRAPVWHDFFSRWTADVAAGRRYLEPFQVQPIPIQLWYEAHTCRRKQRADCGIQLAALRDES